MTVNRTHLSPRASSELRRRRPDNQSGVFPTHHTLANVWIICKRRTGSFGRPAQQSERLTGKRRSSIRPKLIPRGKMRHTVLIAIFIWGVLILGGFYYLSRHEFLPGTFASPPQDWPASSEIARDAGQPTLVIFAHPHCPCTRATLSELARIVAGCREPLNVVVLFLRPAGFDSAWTHSDLWTTATEIPHAHVAEDPDGREAKIFHAVTSGQGVLYDAAGKLRFSGGITGSRGHEGQNAGRAAVVEIVRGRSSPLMTTPVFGCPLTNPPATGCKEHACQP